MQQARSTVKTSNSPATTPQGGRCGTWGSKAKHAVAQPPSAWGSKAEHAVAQPPSASALCHQVLPEMGSFQTGIHLFAPLCYWGLLCEQATTCGMEVFFNSGQITWPSKLLHAFPCSSKDFAVKPHLTSWPTGEHVVALSWSPASHWTQSKQKARCKFPSNHSFQLGLPIRYDVLIPTLIGLIVGSDKLLWVPTAVLYASSHWKEVKEAMVQILPLAFFFWQSWRHNCKKGKRDLEYRSSMLRPQRALSVVRCQTEKLFFQDDLS